MIVDIENPVGNFPSPCRRDRTLGVGEEFFNNGIASVLAEAPADIGRAAMDRITRTLKFTPTRAEVAEAVAEMTAKRQITLRAIKAHLREHQRRREEDGKQGPGYHDMTDDEKIEFDRKILQLNRGGPRSVGAVADRLVNAAKGS